jgi:hypothetical protein
MLEAGSSEPSGLVPGSPVFVTTARGGSPGSMRTGVLPPDPAHFADAISEALPGGTLLPPRRKPHRRATAAAAPPRRSARLAKKTGHRVPAEVAAQNVLMR